VADNETTQSATLATLPAGVTYAFDELTGGVKVARSKTGFGVDGSYVDVSASDPLPVVQTGTPALPTGAATSAKQDTAAAILATIDADTGSIATSAATLAGAVSGTEMQVDVLTMPTVAVTGTFWQATQPVSAASLPLPSGASTLAEQQTQTTHLDTIANGVDGVEGLLAALTGTVAGTELQVDVVTMPTTTAQDRPGA
jgi:hypothetical protein